MNEVKKPVPGLGIPQNTIEVLNKYKFVFQKKFGQNFLIDTHVLDKSILWASLLFHILQLQKGCRYFCGRFCAGNRPRDRYDDAISGCVRQAGGGN